MLDATTFPDLIREQLAQHPSPAETLRAFGLNLSPEERNGEDFTQDEMILSMIADASVQMTNKVAEDNHLSEGLEIGHALNALMIGLVLGYLSGVREGLETPFSGDTFPEDWAS